MAELAAVVASEAVIVAGDAATFKCTLKKDGATYALTGKTITATIRERGREDTVIDEDLEDMAVTLGNTNTTTANGGVTLALTAANTTLLAPSGASSSYLLTFHVSTDDFTTQALGFRVRNGARG